MMNDITKSPRTKIKPKTYELTHNRFNTYLVAMFTDENRAQIYKMV